MSWDLWNFLFGLVGALAVLAPAVLYLGRKVKSLAIFTDPRFEHFLDDWFGEPARPGVPERPGAMRRFELIESRLVTVEADTRQLQRNGGTHLRDAIDRLEAAVKHLPQA